MFRDRHPVAWSYHRRTSRWPFNMHDLNPQTREIGQFKEDTSATTVALPRPMLPTASIASAITSRVSCRQFASTPLPVQQLSNVLHAGYGVLSTIDLWGEFCERTVPSGGGLYPLELNVLTQRIDGLDGGVYHYLPLLHALEVVRADPLPSLMTAEMFLGQPYLRDAAAVIVITAVTERSLWKYEDRGYRYILLEAGHVAQNINLCATADGLGCLNLGGFFDEDVSSLLRLNADQEIVLYGIAIGRPRTNDRIEQRRSTETDSAFRRY